MSAENAKSDTEKTVSRDGLALTLALQRLADLGRDGRGVNGEGFVALRGGVVGTELDDGRGAAEHDDALGVLFGAHRGSSRSSTSLSSVCPAARARASADWPPSAPRMVKT